MNTVIKKLLMIICLVGVTSSIIAMEKQPEKTRLEKILDYAANAVYFTYPNARFLYTGFRGAWETFRTSKMNLPTIKEIDKLALSPATKEALINASSKMRLNETTKIAVQPLFGSPVAAAHNLLLVSDKGTHFSEREEQEFAFGHEMSHVNHNDTLHSIILGFTVPVISYGLLKGCEFGIDKFWDMVKRKYASENSNRYNTLSNIQFINKTIISNPFTYYLLNLYIYNAASRYEEMRADYESATLLNRAEAGIRVMKHMGSDEYFEDSINMLNQGLEKAPWHAKLHLVAQLFDGRLGAPSHPSLEMRIKALEKLITK